MFDSDGNYVGDSTLFCSECGNLQINTNVYLYCSICENLVYYLKNYSIQNPPIMKAMGLAVAILRLECPEILLIEYNQHTSTETIFTETKGCIPEHIRSLKERNLRREYLNSITRLLDSEQQIPIKGYLTDRQNVRTAILSHIKAIIYRDEEQMKQVNPLKHGDFHRVFKACEKRITNAICNLIEYSGNIYYCIECETIGDREILLPDGRSQLENCAECK